MFLGIQQEDKMKHNNVRLLAFILVMIIVFQAGEMPAKAQNQGNASLIISEGILRETAQLIACR